MIALKIKGFSCSLYTTSTTGWTTSVVYLDTQQLAVVYLRLESLVHALWLLVGYKFQLEIIVHASYTMASRGLLDLYARVSRYTTRRS